MKNIRLIIYCSMVCMIFSNRTYSQTWSSGSSKLYANPTSTKIGIGITSPVSPLHVQKSLYGPVNEEYRAVIYGYNTSTETSYKNPIGLLGKVNGQNGMAVYGWNLNSGGYGGYFVGKGYFSGNVGIGTTSPSQKLHVVGDILADGGWVRVDGQKGLYFNDYGGGFYMKDNTWIRTYNDKSFYHNTGTMRTDGTFQVGPNGERFNVNTNGNIGIANESPSYKLDVNGSINFTGQLLHNGSQVDFGSSGGSSYWEDANGGIHYSNGNVGLGTDNPQNMLHLFYRPGTTTSDPAYNSPGIRFDETYGYAGFDIHRGAEILYNGRIQFLFGDEEGVGYNDPVDLDNYNLEPSIYFGKYGIQIGDYSHRDKKLEIIGGEIVLTPDGYNTDAFRIHNDPDKFYISGPEIYVGSWLNYFTITHEGKVGIGTENPAEKLSVDGTIIAEEIKVVTNVVPDYVFERDYKLKTLDEVETFISENGHLPGIPSQEEVQEEGSCNLGEMNTLLLEKIEELTLYVIEQNKKIETLENQLKEINK